MHEANPALNNPLTVAPEKLPDLIRIGLAAIEYEDCSRAAIHAKHIYNATFYRQRGALFDGRPVQRDSEEWALLMAATDPEYTAYRDAKRSAQNARRRLQRITDKFRPPAKQEFPEWFYDDSTDTPVDGNVAVIRRATTAMQ